MSDIDKKISSRSLMDKILVAIADGTFRHRIADFIHRRLERFIYLCADWYYQKTSKQHSPKIKPCGNYYLDASRVKSDDIVYSCGVGKNICFDEELHKTFGCDVYMFDPTPIATDYMAQQKNRPYFKFYPWGVWIKNQAMKFHYKFEDKDEKQNLSVTNLQHSDRYITLDCYSLPNIMKQLFHDRVDILKMDIEGAALPVLEKLVESDIRPKQILFELEKGKTLLLDFHKSMHKLLKKLHSEGYNLYFLSRIDKTRYNFDFLAVKEDAMVA
jgi:FkbM family methyltransferase